MATIIKEAHFSVDVVGDESDERFLGSFSVKTRLSQSDKFAQDAMRRQILGPDSANATEFVAQMATILAFLHVYVKTSPDWWKQNRNGLDMPFENVILEVFNEAIKAINTAKASIVKSGEEAKQELKEHKVE